MVEKLLVMGSNAVNGSTYRRSENKAIVWQILFPDYFAGVCYYANLVPRAFP